jgi:hypothetical protein
MPGIAVRGKDKAGGEQGKTIKHPRFRVKLVGDDSPGDPVITVGDLLHSHGDTPHSEPVMVEGESRFRVNGDPVCRAGHIASCGDPTTGRVRFRVETANSGFPPYRIVPSPPCNVEHIPWVMRAKGWDKGLALMERWFRESASTDKSLPPDTTTITMDWLLGYTDVFGWYKFLITPARWLFENGQDAQGNPTSPIDRLCKQLATRGLLTGRRETFDDFHETPQQLRANKRQIDVFQITPVAFGPNDLIASLAVFELFLVVAGYVEPNANGGHTIVIEKTGVFAQDDYDFNNEPGQDQPLGRWDMDSLAVYFGGDEGCEITNQSFQDYRAATGYGGDFEVYSDLRIERPLLPQVFNCTGP